jgi:hypothetical protein
MITFDQTAQAAVSTLPDMLRGQTASKENGYAHVE